MLSKSVRNCDETFDNNCGLESPLKNHIGADNIFNHCGKLFSHGDLGDTWKCTTQANIAIILIIKSIVRLKTLVANSAMRMQKGVTLVMNVQTNSVNSNK